MKLTLSLALILGALSNVHAETCTFTGAGDGTSWTDADNWSCGSVPNPSNDDIIIPVGQNTINDGSYDVAMDNGHDLSIFGSLNMGDAKIEISQPGSVFTMGSSAVLNNTKELFIVSNGLGNVAYGAEVNVRHLKVDDNGVFTINSCDVNISYKFEVLSSARIIGGGKIHYGGSSGNYVNNGNGIFGCMDPNPGGCDLGSCFVVLPIELAEFNAQRLTDEIMKISWITLSETNNEYFTLERSEDGANWNLVGQLDGAGNSQSVLHYEMIDRIITEKVIFYRLTQTDFDGSFTRSDIVTVFPSSSHSELSVYPNPASDIVTVSGLASTNDAVQLINSTNQDVLNQVSVKKQGSSNVQLDVTNLETGVYFLLSNGQMVRIVVL